MIVIRISGVYRVVALTKAVEVFAYFDTDDAVDFPFEFHQSFDNCSADTATVNKNEPTWAFLRPAVFKRDHRPGSFLPHRLIEPISRISLLARRFLTIKRR